MPAASRLNDPCTGHGCFPPRNNASASSDVLVNGKGVHREGDDWAVHCCGPSCHGGKTAQGSPNVFVNGKAKARIGDAVDCGSAIAAGSSNVFLNEENGRAGNALSVVQDAYKVQQIKQEMTSKQENIALTDDCKGKKLVELPDTFDKQGWRIAARLMRHWFAHPSSADKSNNDSITLPHDWLYQFKAYQNTYQDLINNLWNLSAQQQLALILEKDGIKEGYFDYTVNRELIIQKHHQSRAYEGLEMGFLSNPTDFNASIGRFRLYASAKGRVNSGVIEIERFSVVMRDNYDFEGAYFLGFWNCEAGKFSTTEFLGAEILSNGNFRDFREISGRGGDFYVFSETRHHEIAQS